MEWAIVTICITHPTKRWDISTEAPRQLADSSSEAIIATYHGIEVPDAPHLGPGMIKSMNEGRYERREIQAGLAVIRPGARILEMGAGSGVVGAAIAKNCKAERVLAIEANPELLPYITGLYQHNDLADVISVSHGVVLSEPNPPETIDFFLRGNFLGSGLTIVKNPHKARKVTVPTIAYDALRAEFPHDVIVMDIEGAELEFLRHANLDGVDTIVAEMHRDIYGREGMQGCRASLAKAGFEMDVNNSKAGVHVYRRKSG